MNGIPSAAKIEKGYTEVVISKPEEFAKFKKEFDAIPWPAEYYELVEFIKQAGPNFAKASE